MAEKYTLLHERNIETCGNEFLILKILCIGILEAVYFLHSSIFLSCLHDFDFPPNELFKSHSDPESYMHTLQFQNVAK